MTRPDQTVWCDGPQEENTRIQQQLVREGHNWRERENLSELFPSPERPDRRGAHGKITFHLLAGKETPVRPNNWMPPAEAKEKLGVVHGSMKAGRCTHPLYPGPARPTKRIGVDSPTARTFRSVPSDGGMAKLRWTGWQLHGFRSGIHSWAT